jgi:hypothetical protein
MQTKMAVRLTVGLWQRSNPTDEDEQPGPQESGSGFVPDDDKYLLSYYQMCWPVKGDKQVTYREESMAKKDDKKKDKKKEAKKKEKKASEKKKQKKSAEKKPRKSNSSNLSQGNLFQFIWGRLPVYCRYDISQIAIFPILMLSANLVDDFKSHRLPNWAIGSPATFQCSLFHH